MGYETQDDAGVYRLTDELAIITTADFITPPVDDPFIFGQIAAANALSDVYAMGGRPITCLNLVGFPVNKLAPEILHQIVAGGLDKITEAGAVLAGGHSTEDEEPKFGLSVTGVVHPKKIWKNSGAKPGDVLILTKPIGSGVILNANLNDMVSPEALTACIQTISALNKTTAEALSRFDVHASTDVTGFGLAGHALEMAKGAGVTIEMILEKVPVMAEALEMYEKGISTGVNGFNRQSVEKYLRFEVDLPIWRQEIIFDPQTSGGLLVAVPEAQGEEIIQQLHKADVQTAVIVGKVADFQAPNHIIIR